MFFERATQSLTGFGPPPPMFEQNGPGEGALDHDSIESQHPHNYMLTVASWCSHTPLSLRLGELNIVKLPKGFVQGPC